MLKIYFLWLNLPITKSSMHLWNSMPKFEKRKAFFFLILHYHINLSWVYSIAPWHDRPYLMQVKLSVSFWAIPINHISWPFIASFTTSKEPLIRYSFTLLQPCSFLALIRCWFNYVPTLNDPPKDGVCSLARHWFLESKKQTIISKCSAEAEYCCLSCTSSGVIWLQRLLHELGVFIIDSTPIYAHNTIAIQRGTNMV